MRTGLAVQFISWALATPIRYTTAAPRVKMVATTARGQISSNDLSDSSRRTLVVTKCMRPAAGYDPPNCAGIPPGDLDKQPLISSSEEIKTGSPFPRVPSFS